MTTVCGLDFGTSNSTIGINQMIGNQRKARLVPLENDEPRLRSAIFYRNELKQLIFGEQGVHEYLLGEPGRLMMSLKSLLGSSLLNDKTLIDTQLIPYTDILGEFIGYMKRKAETLAQEEIIHVVLGRPVIFHPDAERDALAQQTLENIVRQQGFKHIAFQYEPFGAGLTYESELKDEELVLVIDMGGGTSDFTIIKLGSKNPSLDRNEDILANHGVRIGGTDLDKRFSLISIMPLLGRHSLMRGSSSDIDVPDAIYHDLTSWHLLRQLYKPNIMHDVRRIYQVAYAKPLIQRLIDVLEDQQGHRILDLIENAKKKLSDIPKITLDVSFVEESLNVDVSNQEFNEMITSYREKLIAAINDTVMQASIKNGQIQAIFYTGGTTRVPIIREDIRKLFPQAKIIHGDVFGSVGFGLTLDAINKFLNQY